MEGVSTHCVRSLGDILSRHSVREEREIASRPNWDPNESERMLGPIKRQMRT